MCTNIFFRAKTRFHLPRKRAVFVTCPFDLLKHFFYFQLFCTSPFLIWFSCTQEFPGQVWTESMQSKPFFPRKNKVSPPPKARDFRRFFHWFFCTTQTFDVELSTVGKLFLNAFQRYQARYLKCPWCNCPNVFFLRKSRKIKKNRANFGKSFRLISTPQQLTSSSLEALESLLHALSNGSKLDFRVACGADFSPITSQKCEENRAFFSMIFLKKLRTNISCYIQKTRRIKGLQTLPESLFDPL